MEIDILGDQERGLLVLTLTGSLIMSDLDQILEDVSAELPGGEEVFDVLVDGTNANPGPFTMTEMDAIAKRTDRLSWSSRVRREALVASDRTALGLLKLYVQFGQSDRETRIFRCRETAEAWLDGSSD